MAASLAVTLQPEMGSDYVDKLPTTSNDRTRFEIFTAADALKPQPPIDYLLDNLITRGSVNVFYGEPGSKKTYSMLDLGVCVAAGKNWLGFKTKQARVLIVDEESGRIRLSRRLGETLRGEMADETTPISYTCLNSVKLDRDLDAIALQTIIEKTGAELIIIDALADIFDGDENSKQEIQPAFTNLRRIAEQTNVAIILIHHSNKMGGYRGSSAIKGAVDLMVLVTSEEGSETINYKVEKIRDGERTNWAARAVWTPEGEFYLVSEELAAGVNKPAEEFVLKYLKEHGSADIETIQSAAPEENIAKATARNAVYSLGHKGLIKRTNKGERGSRAIYDLSNKGDGNA